MTCPNVSYDKLMASPQLCEQFKENCKDATAKNLDLDPFYVEVSLAKGSVVVQTEISPPPGMDPVMLEQKAKSPAMSKSVQDFLVASLDKKEMKKILSSGKSITVNDPVVVPVSMGLLPLADKRSEASRKSLDEDGGPIVVTVMKTPRDSVFSSQSGWESRGKSDIPYPMCFSPGVSVEYWSSRHKKFVPATVIDFDLNTQRLDVQLVFNKQARPQTPVNILKVPIREGEKVEVCLGEEVGWFGPCSVVRRLKTGTGQSTFLVKSFEKVFQMDGTFLRRSYSVGDFVTVFGIPNSKRALDCEVIESHHGEGKELPKEVKRALGHYEVDPELGNNLKPFHRPIATDPLADPHRSTPPPHRILPRIHAHVQKCPAQYEHPSWICKDPYQE